MKAKDLLGTISQSTPIIKGIISPFNKDEVLESLIRENDGAIPHYCTLCGLTSYLLPEDAEKILAKHNRTLPEENFIYIENSGCPHCLNGEIGDNPIVNKLT